LLPLAATEVPTDQRAEDVLYDFLDDLVRNRLQRGASESVRFLWGVGAESSGTLPAGLPPLAKELEYDGHALRNHHLSCSSLGMDEASKAAHAWIADSVAGGLLVV
jgi:hypothetical protein